MSLSTLVSNWFKTTYSTLFSPHLLFNHSLKLGGKPSSHDGWFPLMKLLTIIKSWLADHRLVQHTCWAYLSFQQLVVQTQDSPHRNTTVCSGSHYLDWHTALLLISCCFTMCVCECLCKWHTGVVFLKAAAQVYPLCGLCEIVCVKFHGWNVSKLPWSQLNLCTEIHKWLEMVWKAFIWRQEILSDQNQKWNLDGRGCKDKKKKTHTQTQFECVFVCDWLAGSVWVVMGI